VIVPINPTIPAAIEVLPAALTGTGVPVVIGVVTAAVSKPGVVVVIIPVVEGV